jgi:hypothetical protein
MIQHLWIVVMLYGHIGATFGPLPYDMDECLHRIADKKAEIAADPVKVKKADEANFIMVCEYHEERPK